MAINFCWHWQRSANNKPVWVRFDPQSTQWLLATGDQDFDIPFKNEHFALFIDALKRFLDTGESRTFKRSFDKADLRDTEVNAQGCLNNKGNCIFLDNDDKYRLLLVLKTLYTLDLIDSIFFRFNEVVWYVRNHRMLIELSTTTNSRLPSPEPIRPIAWSWQRSANNKLIWIKIDVENDQWLITPDHPDWEVPFRLEHLNSFVKALESYMISGHAQHFERNFGQNDIRDTEVNSSGLVNNRGNTIALNSQDLLNLYSILSIYKTLLLTLNDFHERLRSGRYIYSPYESDIFPLSSVFSPRDEAPRIPSVIRQSLGGGGWVDYPLRRIYGHPSIPDGAFLDSLGNVRDPKTGNILGRLIGDQIVPPPDH